MTIAPPGVQDVEALARQAESLALDLRDSTGSLTAAADALEWRSPAAERMRAQAAERGRQAHRIAADLEGLAHQLRVHARTAVERAAAIQQALAAAERTLIDPLSQARP